MSPSSLAPPDPDLARVLRRLRLERGESQEAVARQAGISRNAYQEIERGTTSPAWSTVRRIISAFDMSVARFGNEIDKEDRG